MLTYLHPTPGKPIHSYQSAATLVSAQENAVLTKIQPCQQTRRRESKFYQKSWEHLYNQPYASQYKSSGHLSTLSHTLIV